MKGRLLGILVLIAWGVFKLPIESHQAAILQEQRLGGFKPTATLRQQLGQAGLLAALGGMRSAVADILWLRANDAWRDVQYGRMKLYFDICTSLQPRRELFWDMAAWHMAFNGGAYMEDPSHDQVTGIQNPEQRREKMLEFYRIGERYLLDGIQNMPDSWVLYDRLGSLYHDKFHDPCRAWVAFDEASKRPGRLDYVRRFAAYNLADCPGHEREAYERLLALYKESENEWLPALLDRLQKLERKLNIPKEGRVYIPPKERLPPE